jgi:hypothetical protein
MEACDAQFRVLIVEQTSAQNFRIDSEIGPAKISLDADFPDAGRAEI